MDAIWYFYPADRETYLRMLNELTPILDREGIFFHIARPPLDRTTPKPVVRLKNVRAKGVKQ